MDNMDMSSTTNDTMMVFTNSKDATLYSMMWTPSSTGAYAGTCIFLIILGITFRGLVAIKSILEQRWMVQAHHRRYIVVKGRPATSERIESSPDSKDATLVSAQGLEENVKVVKSNLGGPVPFRLSVDIPRAVLVLFIAGVGYLLMLAVMTMNVGYFMSVIVGHFVGELAVGRFAVMGEHF